MENRGRNPRRPERQRQPDDLTRSPLTIALAAILLFVVAAIVGWIIFGVDLDDGDAGDGSTPEVTQTATVSGGNPPATPNGGVSSTTPSAQAPSGQSTPAATATTSSPSPTPTPTPVVGTFGELPGADMPSGSSLARPLNMTYRLDLSLQQVPEEAPVYQLLPRTWNQQEAAALASSLGITGPVTSQGSGSFQASGNGELYIAGNLVQYIADTTATPIAGALPEDDDAVDIARDWLLSHQLTGANTGAGTVVERDESSGRLKVRVKPLDPDPILSATPSASITIGAGGEVVEAHVQWPGSFERSTYGLRGPDELWSAASQGRGYIEIDPSLVPAGSGPLSGQAVVNGVSTAYAMAGSPLTKHFLVPVVVFKGQATLDGVDQSVPVSIYVPAVGAQAAPRG